jgi:hypothetical protein
MCSSARGVARAGIAFGLLLALPAGSAGAMVLMTVEEALGLAFPDCEVERETIFLTEEEVSTAGEMAHRPQARALVVRYVARRDGALFGTAYFDTHQVRTLDETIMVVVRPDGTIDRVEVISFGEPPDYLPREGWYRQFDGRRLNGDLEIDRGIRAVTGATLTAEATTSAARTVLAIHELIENRGDDR